MPIFIAPWQYREFEREGRDMSRFEIGLGPDRKPQPKPSIFTNREARRAAEKARRRKR